MNNHTFDCSELALKIFSGIYRAQEKYGAALIAEMLCGSQSIKMKSTNLEQLSTYGIIKDLSVKQVRAVIRYLMHLGFIHRSFKHSALYLTSKAKLFLKTRPPLKIPSEIIEKAKEEMFSRKILPTYLETLKMWESGKDPAAIAALRNLKESTIGDHLANLVFLHEIVDVKRLISPQKQEVIKRVLAENNWVKLREINEKLPKEITYTQIKIVLALSEPRFR